MKKRMKKVATLCLAGVTAMSTVGVTGSTVFADETNYDVDNMDFDNVELRVAFRYNNGSDTDGQSIWYYKALEEFNKENEGKIHVTDESISTESDEAFCEEGDPCVITMENLKGITEVQPLGEKVFIVENEMVFSYLIDNLTDRNCTLLCTSGQLRFVSQKLIGLILEKGTDIYYSGDIDPDGMGIADRLWLKFGDRIHPWRMSPEDYEKSISGEHIGENGLAKLFHIQHPLLKKTAEYVKQKQLSAYQENILKELLIDMEKAGEP